MCGYFEPCSEWLLQDSGDHIERSMTTERFKRLRHPVSSHYFSEFPFETGVGVAGFQKRFSFETYYMRRRQPDPELRQYIGDLVRRADCTHRRAAMKFCRFGLRSGWLRQAFSPSIVYVLREPDAMFRSYWSLGGRRSYFILASLLLVCKNRQSELFREVASALDLPGVDGNTVFDELVHVYEASLRYTAQDFRDVLLVLWVLNAVHNMACADLVIDIDLLGTDRHYREVAQAGLSEICGHPLTFDDYRASGVEEAPGACLSDRGIEWARHAVRALGRDAGAWAARASGASESVFAALG